LLQFLTGVSGVAGPGDGDTNVFQSEFLGEAYLIAVTFLFMEAGEPKLQGVLKFSGARQAFLTIFQVSEKQYL
jgi:hypothetical protein